MLKRCKGAANSISELEKQKKKFPLTCVLSNETLPTIAANHNFLNKSPLIANDNNLLFNFQATTLQCRKAVESNPIRNIYGPMLPLARNFGMDLISLSARVEREADIQPPGTEQVFPQQQQQEIQPKAAQKTLQVVTNRRAVSKGTQTDRYDCNDCERRERIKRDAKNAGSQTARSSAHDIGTQCETDDGSAFSFTIDEKDLQHINFEQHHALKLFTKLFNIPCKYFDQNDSFDDEGDKSPYSYMTKNERVICNDDRMNFANPVNPKANEFVTLSPIRRSISPRRNTIFDRVGEKIHNSPIFGSLRKSPSPLASLQTLSKNSYIVPAPNWNSLRHLQGRISPGPSNRFRNRSRSRSRSPQRSRSPPRQRSRSPVAPQRRRFDLNERRGRY